MMKDLNHAKKKRIWTIRMITAQRKKMVPSYSLIKD